MEMKSTATVPNVKKIKGSETMPSKKRLISVGLFVLAIVATLMIADWYIQHGSGFSDAIRVRDELGGK